MKDVEFFEQRIREKVNLLMSMQGLDRLFHQIASLIARELARGCHVFFVGEGTSKHLASLLASHWQQSLFGEGRGDEFISVISCDEPPENWPGGQGDILVACAPSAPGMELLRALTRAGEEEMTIVALTGAEPWLISGLSALCLCVPSTDSLRTSEEMLFLGHSLAQYAQVLMTEELAQDVKV